MTKLAYVGTPCHVEGLSKVAALSREIRQDWPDKVALKVGLFCRENWCYTCFRALVEDDYGVKLEDVVKFDIKKNNLIGYQKNGDKLEFPLRKAKPYVRINCQVCLTFTSEISDLSVGAVGSPAKWSTVIARTKKGMEIVKQAEKEGYVEVKPIEDVKPGIKLVKRIAKDKKEASMKEAEGREKNGIHVPHIKTMNEKNFENAVKNAKGKTFSELNSDVIEPGLCTSCGVCEAVCSEGCVEVIEERPMLVGKCKEDCPSCYVACPRTSLPLAAMEDMLFGGTKMAYEEGIGKFLDIFAVRARNEKILEKGQDGGAVTALLSYAMDKKIIDGVVSVKTGEEPWKPSPALSLKTRDLLEASGTIYSMPTTIPSIKTMD